MSRLFTVTFVLLLAGCGSDRKGEPADPPPMYVDQPTSSVVCDDFDCTEESA